MSMRENGARYKYGLSRLRIRALNDDLTTPSASNMIGGAGPFDFSGAVDDEAVTGYIKRDGGDTESFTIDISAAVGGISAVTVDEWVTAMAAGLTAASITGITASKDSTTNRAKLVSSSGTYIQFWGEASTMAMFGQGWGLKARCSDTMQSTSVSPTVKDDTEQTTTDSNGKDTTVIVSGYKKGLTATLVDTAEDFEMMELVEGGSLNAAGTEYTDPDSSTTKPVFEVEFWNPLYTSGENQEDQIIGWEHTTLRKCKGSVGEENFQAGFGTKSYSITGVNYKTAAGVESGAKIVERLAVTAWDPDDFDEMVA